ncbi:hypothetical protein QBC39DRAFT_431798 [Podospora conica]|nr:hypothetical protein QBC39DRAFT_431798 [Schizothecium conicum]
MASPYPIQASLAAIAELPRAIYNNPHRAPEALPVRDNRALDHYTHRDQPRRSALKPIRAPNASLFAALQKSKNKPLLSTSAPLPRIFHSQETLVDGRDRFWDVDLENGQQRPTAAVLPARSNDHEYTVLEAEKQEANTQWLAKLTEKKLKRMDKKIILALVLVLLFIAMAIAAVAVLSWVYGPW